MKNLNKEIKLPKIIHTLGDKYQLSNFDKNLLYVVYKAVSKDYKNNLFLRVDSVSKTGMSRKIDGAVIYDQGIISITYLLRKLKIIDKRNSIRGCGMDMLFEVSYILFLTLHASKRYQDKLSRYAGY